MQTGNQEAEENLSHPTTLPSLGCSAAQRPLLRPRLTFLQGAASLSKGHPERGLASVRKVSVGCFLGGFAQCPKLACLCVREGSGTLLLPALVAPTLVCGSRGLLRAVSTTYTTLFCASSRHLFLHLWAEVLQAYQKISPKLPE